MQSLHMSVVLYMLNTLLGAVHGHGYLKNPPSRSSMWRLGFNTPKNYNDHQLFCGGFANQKKLGGKCGLCGDPYNQAAPRDNEAGGKYATGVISKYYIMDSTVDITARISSNHLGYFEFRLCENNDVTKTVTRECLKHLLVNPKTGETKHYIGNQKGDIVTRVKLPKDVTCSQCVLQWRYHTENNWGTDEDGTKCTGCGPQEEFYGCSDIAISNPGVNNTTSTPKTSTLPAILKSSTTKRTTTAAAAATTTTTKTTVQKQTTIPTKASTTVSTIKTTTIPTTPSTDAKRTTTASSTDKVTCVSIAAPADDKWCDSNCNHAPYYCPPDFCHCNGLLPLGKGRFIKLLLSGIILQ